MTNKEVFEKVKHRLEDEVGTLLKIIDKERERKINEKVEDWCPWFALGRMMFPIAESIGRLIHKTGDPLLNIFEKDLIKCNSKYADNPATVIILYRHSLIHQDVLRVMHTKSAQVGWHLNYGFKNNHLKVNEIPTIGTKHRTFSIEFDFMQFYEDLVKVCEEKIKNPPVGAADRFNEWEYYNLITEQKDGTLQKKSQKEIESLIKNS